MAKIKTTNGDRPVRSGAKPKRNPARTIGGGGKRVKKRGKRR